MATERSAARANGRLVAGVFAAFLVVLSGFIGFRVYDFQHSEALQAGRPSGARVLIAESGDTPLLDETLLLTAQAFRQRGGVIVTTREETEDRKSRIWTEDYRILLETVPAYGGRRIIVELVHLDSGEALARDETFVPDNAADTSERLTALASRAATEWTGVTGIIETDRERRAEKRR